MEVSADAVVPPDAAVCRLSMVRPHGSGRSSCGYCSSPQHDRVSFGMSATQLSCADYGSLCDRGWRRSGHYVYCPLNATTCCPNITIRLDVTRFQASHAQLRVLRKLNHYLFGGEDAAADEGVGIGAAAHSQEKHSAQTLDSQLLGDLNLLLHSAALEALPDLAQHVPPPPALGLKRLKEGSRAVTASDAFADGSHPTHACSLAFQVAAAANKAAGAQMRRRSGAHSAAAGVASAGGGGDLGAAAAVTPSSEAPPPASLPAAAAATATAESVVECSAAEVAARIAQAARTLLARLDGGASGAVAEDPEPGAARESKHRLRGLQIAALASGSISLGVPASFLDAGTAASSGQGADAAVTSHSDNGAAAAAHPAGTAASAVRPPTPSPASATKKQKRGPAPAAASSSSEASVLPSAPGTRHTASIPTAAPSDRPAAAPRHTWRVVTVPSSFEEESWLLYRKYQVAVHHDDPSKCTREQYKRFLCDSALIPAPSGAPAGCDVLHYRGGEGAQAGPAPVSTPAASTTPAAAASAPALTATVAAVRWIVGRGGRGYKDKAVRSALAKSGGDASLALELLGSEQRRADGNKGASSAVDDAPAVAWGSEYGQAIGRVAVAESAAWRAAIGAAGSGEGGTKGAAKGSLNSSSAPASEDSAAIVVPQPTVAAGPLHTQSSSATAASSHCSSSSSSTAAGDGPLLPPQWHYAGFRPGAEHISPDLPGGAQYPGAGLDRSPAGGGGLVAAVGAQPSQLGTTAGVDPAVPSSNCTLYGSFHHKYYVDGKLVAVGVVDILPQCLSSVYVFYDPEVSASLQLGKVTALREIQWVQNAMRCNANLRFYYMGFYVHNCPKMRYKSEYEPSDLRCDVTGLWVPLATALPRLRASGGKFCALAGELDLEGRARVAAAARLDTARIAALLPHVPLFLGGQRPVESVLALLRDLNERGRKTVVALLLELGGLTGPALLERLLVAL